MSSSGYKVPERRLNKLEIELPDLKSREKVDYLLTSGTKHVINIKATWVYCFVLGDLCNLYLEIANHVEVYARVFLCFMSVSNLH